MQISHVSCRMKRLPWLCARLALARLQDEQEGVQARSHFCERKSQKSFRSNFVPVKKIVELSGVSL